MEKGITLPVNAVVIIVLAALVFGAVALLFTSTGGQQISKADAERIFFAKCQSYCDKISSGNNYRLAAALKETDPEFFQSCTVKGIQWKDANGEIPARCLAACPCDLSTTAGETNADNACVLGCLNNYPAGSADGEACIRGCG